jgi:Fe-S-cluster containining protein
MNEAAHDFQRTKCACNDCRKCCKRQPGPLAAGDFERIQQHLGLTDDEMKKKFWASPGSLVKDLRTSATRRIGSITPRYHKGKCVFLDEQERCTIHEVAPFGCAYFDTHMSNVTAHPRSVWLALSCDDPNYKKQRDSLPYATHYKPTRY